MNQKLPFHELAQLYAEVTGVNLEDSERFLKNFFDLLGESIINGQEVSIKSIGSFTLVRNLDEPVAFTPAPELARSINAPFALFEPELLADETTDEALEAIALEPIVIPEIEEEKIDSLPEPETHLEIETETIEAETIAAETTIISEIASEIPNDEPLPTAPVEDTATTSDTPTEETQSISTEETTEVETPVEPSPAESEPIEPVIEPELSVPTVDTPEPDEAPAATPLPPMFHGAPTPEPVTVTPAEETSTEEPIPVEPKQPEDTLTQSVATEPIKPTVSTPPAPVKPIAPKFEVDLIPEEPEELVQKPRRHREHRSEHRHSEHRSHKKSNSGFGLGFLVGILVGLALGACAAYLAIDYLFPVKQPAEIVEEESVELEVLPPLTDSVAPPQAEATTPAAQQAETAKPAETPAQPANAAVVTDEIQKGYLINDMAKKHFGNKAFWVYIYEENKAKIKNPNSMQPGDKLVIPPAEKYGIDASNPQSVKTANDKASKILSQFPR